MLVLSRKTNQSIVINGDVIVTVKDVRRGRVCLGIKAPKDVRVVRQEIVERLRGETMQTDSALKGDAGYVLTKFTDPKANDQRRPRLARLNGLVDTAERAS